jgi:hypothetical protein
MNTLIKSSVDTINKKDSLVNKSVKEVNTTVNQKNQTNNIKAETFISAQKINQNIIAQTKIKESNEILKKDNGLSVEEKIQMSAKTLELNLNEKETKISLEKPIIPKEKNINKELLNHKVSEQNNFLNKMFLNKNLKDEIIVKKISTSIIEEKKVLTNSIKEEDIEISKEVKLSVEAITAQNILNKIIGAKQKINSFMSDLSRQMYQNYKPPITAFRIKLNPANLGSIAIVMKSNKTDQSMNISMNITSSSTYETMQLNKNTLHENLQSSFENINEFSMDFNMNDEGSETYNEQKETNSKDDKLTTQNQEEQIQINNSNYM